MKMKAVVVVAQGGTDVLHLRDVDLSWPAGTHDVLVTLKFASLNPADVFFRQLGGYVQSDAPFVLGHDGMGVVSAVGASVTKVRAGDRVCFCNGGIGGTMGTYAEAAVVPEWKLAKVPDGVDDRTAAALPLVSITAWEALHERMNIQSGEHVLVHAGAGGTGHVAIQLAKLARTKVATTVSSAAKALIATGLGADFAINYKEGDFVDEAVAWAGGINAALDNVGGDTLLRTYRAMAPYGRIVTLIGFAGDDADLTAYNMNLSLHSVMMLTPMWKGLEDRLRMQSEIIRKCLTLVGQGELKILHAETFRLADAAKAHNFLESGQAIGKVTLQIS